MTSKHLSVAALAFIASLVPAGADQTPEQWRDDVRFLAQELPKRHANAFHSLPRSEFERRVAELLHAAETATDLQMRAAIVRLMAAIGDTETGAWLGGDSSLPLRFWHFPEGLYCTAAPREFRGAIGARVVAINGIPILRVQELLLPFASAPDEVSRRTAFEPWLRNIVALRATGIAATDSEVEFAFDSGGRQFLLRISPFARDREPPTGESASWIQWRATAVSAQRAHPLLVRASEKHTDAVPSIQRLRRRP